MHDSKGATHDVSGVDMLAAVNLWNTSDKRNLGTLLEVLDQCGRRTDRGFTFLNQRLEPDIWPFDRLIAEVRRRAAYLQAMQLPAEARVAIMLSDARDFVFSFLACVAAGLVPVPMFPALGARVSEEFVLTAKGILDNSQSRVLITGALTKAAPEWLKGIQILSPADLANWHGPAYVEPAGVTPQSLCFLQYTSGSTSAPKGVVVTHASLLANSYAITARLAVGTRDCGVSWLPLHHDMGLIGHMLAPLTGAIPVVFIPTLAFMMRPSVWMETIHKYRGTISFGPNFALALAAKRQRNREELDLSCLRVVGCGAEPINAETLRMFLAAFAPCGLRSEAMMPCYGLAESTLAVTFDAIDRPVRTIVIDRDDYEQRAMARVVAAGVATETLEVVSCGRPFPDHELAVLEEDGTPLPEGAVGEIAVRGPSVTSGYFRADTATKTALNAGWMRTGDRGCVLDGDLFVCGRNKDLLIVDGRNRDPQTLEWVVERIEGVREGGVVAFSLPGTDTETVVIVAEVKPGAASVALAREVRQQLRARLSLLPSEVVLVRAGSLPRTSSGKLKRQLAKQMHRDGALPLLDAI